MAERYGPRRGKLLTKGFLGISLLAAGSLPISKAPICQLLGYDAWPDRGPHELEGEAARLPAHSA